MENITEYQVAHSLGAYDFDFEDLTKRVNELIKQGWMPLGGISCALTADTSPNYLCVQAMVKTSK